MNNEVKEISPRARAVYDVSYYPLEWFSRKDDKTLLIHIAIHAWADGTHSYVTQKVLMEKTGWCESKLRRGIRRLEKDGLLRVERRNVEGTKMVRNEHTILRLDEFHALKQEENDRTSSGPVDNNNDRYSRGPVDDRNELDRPVQSEDQPVHSDLSTGTFEVSTGTFEASTGTPGDRERKEGFEGKKEREKEKAPLAGKLLGAGCFSSPPSKPANEVEADNLVKFPVKGPTQDDLSGKQTTDQELAAEFSEWLQDNEPKDCKKFVSKHPDAWRRFKSRRLSLAENYRTWVFQSLDHVAFMPNQKREIDAVFFASPLEDAELLRLAKLATGQTLGGGDEHVSATLSGGKLAGSLGDAISAFVKTNEATKRNREIADRMMAEARAKFEAEEAEREARKKDDDGPDLSFLSSVDDDDDWLLPAPKEGEEEQTA